MKRLLLATSILALAAGGAFAQGMSNAPSTAPRSGATTAAPVTPGASSSATGSSASSSMGSAMTGSSGSSSQASADDVEKAQQALKQQGLYRGSVDGKVGPETRTAISQFQKQNGLRQTAQLDQQTMDRLEGSGGMNSGSPGSGARMPSNSSAVPAASGARSTSGTDKDDDNDAH